MSGEETTRLMMGLVWVVILVSSLAARRLPLGQTVKMALAWVGIFALIFVGFSFRYEAMQIWSRVTGELSGQDPVGSNGSVRLSKREDGHFWLTASINGQPVTLMVDSGATVTSISAETAKKTGVQVEQGAFPVSLNTANGVVEAQRAKAASFAVGPIQRENFSVFVSPSFGDTDVVGMNFLSTLTSWKVEGETMVLTP
jgi:aspartyl protease family protein